MNENRGFTLIGLGSFFKIFELQFILDPIFAAAIAPSPLVAFSRIIIFLPLSHLACGAVRITSNQPPRNTPHKIKTLYINDNRSHLGFTEYPFEFSSPRSASWEMISKYLFGFSLPISASWETISKMPCEKMKSNLATSGLRIITSQVCGGESYQLSLVLGNTSQSFVSSDTVSPIFVTHPQPQ